DLVAHGLKPGGASQPGDEFAEHAVADVGVVEPATRTVLELVRAEAGVQFGPGAARGALPPRAGGFGGESAGVGEQLGDGEAPELGAGNVLVERVVQVESTFVAQPHDDGGDERLGDRPD